jgi:hypothetical protein
MIESKIMKINHRKSLHVNINYILEKFLGL